MHFLRRIIFTYLYIPYGFRKFTGTGPFGRCRAQPAPSPRPGVDHRLKNALFTYHVKQFNEAACSVATIVTVVNAIGAVQQKHHVPEDQAGILEKVRTGRWKARMSPEGDRGRRGLPLALLGAVVKNCLDACNLRYLTVDTVPVRGTDPSWKKTKNILKSRLYNFETRAGGLIIAHFDQGMWVPTLSVPHISPVGGFDPATGQVAILDVDPDQQPYRIGFETFCRGLSSNYGHVFRHFGYDSGGYVYIKLP